MGKCPCDSQAADRGSELVGSDRLEGCHRIQVAQIRLPAEHWAALSPVGRCEGSRGTQMAAEKTVGQGAVDEDADAGSLGVRKDLGFDVPPKQVVGRLQRLDR